MKLRHQYVLLVISCQLWVASARVVAVTGAVANMGSTLLVTLSKAEGSVYNKL
ncbi:hypothetical protein [Olivibacter sp. XZL3]|uniref:hypothetical protein n=1 Tax=Olivibacter sp. XZL3 TaxID=1735116 RepID=UPI001416F905|nr:hypothetical protein [Olivibacter sp. XZL3]